MSVIKERDVKTSLRSAVSTFEDLEVFQRAYLISLEVHRASLTFPEVERHVLADQIRRASKSICGNIAEGFGKQRRSSAEFRRYLLMAIGSADEMRVCGSEIRRSRNVCEMAGRIPPNRSNASRPLPALVTSS
jgi:four helix bundle protein